MLLREDVVLRRAGRVAPAARWRDVGVARQGVGGCCLGGHFFFASTALLAVFILRRAARARRMAVLGLF